VIRVYIDMVADPFDARHIELLRLALACGDELVVGIHSDDDCEWSWRRPSLGLDERARVVTACPHVDRVLAGAPAFITDAWLREQAVDLVVHSGALPERALRYWYRVPIELGMFRTLPCAASESSTDLEGRLCARDAPASRPDSPGAIARRRLRRWLPGVERMVQRHALADGLRRLADALRGTPLDGRYWVVGGLLLGWAREGRPLESDLQDADFAYLDEDHDRFLASVPALVKAGFEPKHRFSSAGGRYVEHRFGHEGVQFDFFRMTRVGDRWRYSMFESGNEPTELIAEVPAQAHVWFRFLGRDWRKVVDHDLAFRTIYGDWHTDRPGWSFTSDRAIVERIPMACLPYGWAWPHAVARGPGERDGDRGQSPGRG